MEWCTVKEFLRISPEFKGISARTVQRMIKQDIFPLPVKKVPGYGSIEAYLIGIEDPIATQKLTRLRTIPHITSDIRHDLHITSDVGSDPGIISDVGPDPEIANDVRTDLYRDNMAKIQGKYGDSTRTFLSPYGDNFDSVRRQDGYRTGTVKGRWMSISEYKKYCGDKRCPDHIRRLIQELRFPLLSRIIERSGKKYYQIYVTDPIAVTASELLSDDKVVKIKVKVSVKMMAEIQQHILPEEKRRLFLKFVRNMETLLLNLKTQNNSLEKSYICTAIPISQKLYQQLERSLSVYGIKPNVIMPALFRVYLEELYKSFRLSKPEIN